MLRRILLILFIFSSVHIRAQKSDEVMSIDITTVLKIAGTDNLKIAEINARYDLAIAVHLEAKEWFLPVISPGVLMMAYKGNAQSTDGTYIDVDKNSFWGGAALEAEWDLGEAVFRSQSAKVGVESAGFAKRAEKNQRTLEAISAYYDLVASQSKLTALEKVITKSEGIVRQIEIQVTSGMRYKSDLLLAKANLNHIKIEKSRARQQIHTNSNTLMSILNIKSDVLLVVGDTLLIPVNMVDTNRSKVSGAYDKRPEILLSQSKVNALTIQRKTTTKGLLLPNINLGFNDGIYGPYFNPLSNQFSYYLGAKWNIPLGALFYAGERKQFDARIRLAQIGIDQAKNKVRKEILDARSMVHNSKNQMEMAKEALEYANTALNQTIERQRLGTSIPLEVFQAQEQLLKAQVDHIDAIIGYNKAQYALYVALGNNL